MASTITSAKRRSEVLDRVSRTSEILFGLIMVLSFTCSLDAVTGGRSDVREMLLGALGCNVAWGVIDAFFYLMSIAAERGREQVLIRKLKSISDQETAQHLFQEVLPESIIGSLSPESFREMRRHLLANADKGRQRLIGADDLLGALIIFGLVFLTTFPVALPFVFMTEVESALRVSNGIALTMLFGLGYSLGSFAGRRAWLWGAAMVIIGAALVSFTIAMGG